MGRCPQAAAAAFCGHENKPLIRFSGWMALTAFWRAISGRQVSAMKAATPKRSNLISAARCKDRKASWIWLVCYMGHSDVPSQSILKREPLTNDLYHPAIKQFLEKRQIKSAPQAQYLPRRTSHRPHAVRFNAPAPKKLKDHLLVLVTGQSNRILLHRRASTAVAQRGSNALW